MNGKSEKKIIKEALKSIIEDVDALPTMPVRMQVSLIIGQLYEVMRLLSAMAEK